MKVGRYTQTKFVRDYDEMAAWSPQPDPAEPMFAALGAALRENAAWCLLGACVGAGVVIALFA